VRLLGLTQTSAVQLVQVPEQVGVQVDAVPALQDV
jgi:hypothetical protein